MKFAGPPAFTANLFAPHSLARHLDATDATLFL